MEASDAEIVSQLSKDHVLSDIVVCSNDEIVTHLQLQYGVVNQESGKIENVVKGVEHGEAPSPDDKGITCTAKSMLIEGGRVSSLFVRYNTDITQVLFALADKSFVKLGLEGGVNNAGPYNFKDDAMFGFRSQSIITTKGVKLASLAPITTDSQCLLRELWKLDAAKALQTEVNVESLLTFAP